MCAKDLSNQGAFTLTELLVALAIAGMVGAMALPSLASLLRSNRVKQSATDMVMTMAYARNEAINRNVQVSVIAAGSWSDGWQVVAGATPLRQTTISGDVRVGGPAAKSVTYNPDGRLPH
jgi:type IV fimbrial biogenesis protein FimT